jgi:hypothetical protein
MNPDHFLRKLACIAAILSLSALASASAGCSGKEDTRAEPVVSSIKVDKGSVELVVGEKTTVKAGAVPDSPDLPPLEWKSADTKVATVAKGEITGTGVGETVVTVSCLNASRDIKVKVKAQKDYLVCKNEIPILAWYSIPADYTSVARYRELKEAGFHISFTHTSTLAQAQAALKAADANPLGSAALAGTTYPLDRDMTTAELGLAYTIPNSMDAVSDRDYLLDLEYACSVSMMHLTRISEEIVLWSSSEFGFITLSDSWSTGSSIMPQKKNPDFAELTRGKSGRVVGDLVSALIQLKGLPLAYNKDLQECKPPAVDAATTLRDCYLVMCGMLSTMTVHGDVMLESAKLGFTAATDVADYLTKKGMPFREAHAVVGHLVLTCEKRNIGLEDLTIEDLKQASELFESDIIGSLDPAEIARARTTMGGTGHAVVADQLKAARACFEARIG